MDKPNHICQVQANVGRLLGLRPNDILFSSDVDELPWASAVVEGANSVYNFMLHNTTFLPVVEFGLIMYYFR